MVWFLSHIFLGLKQEIMTQPLSTMKESLSWRSNSLAGFFLLLSSPFPSSPRMGGVPQTAVKCPFKTLPVSLTHNWGHSNVKVRPPGYKMWRGVFGRPSLENRISFSANSVLKRMNPGWAQAICYKFSSLLMEFHQGANLSGGGSSLLVTSKNKNPYFFNILVILLTLKSNPCLSYIING